MKERLSVRVFEEGNYSPIVAEADPAAAGLLQLPGRLYPAATFFALAASSFFQSARISRPRARPFFRSARSELISDALKRSESEELVRLAFHDGIKTIGDTLLPPALEVENFAAEPSQDFRTRSQFVAVP